MQPNYLPLNERKPDQQYRSLLKKIMEEGESSRPPQGEEALRVTGYTLRYDLWNGFPLITERDLTKAFRGALGEIIGFIHGARTLDQLKEYGCPRVYWERWVTPEKCALFGLEPEDLGDGSYGMQFGRPKCEGGDFSQIEAAVALAKAMPNTRTIRVTTWRLAHFLLNADPKKRRTVVAPCHGDFTVVLNPAKKELDIHHRQRSADVPVGLVNNIVQYAAMGMMFGQVLGYRMRKLVHHIEDAHVYERQYGDVHKLLEREPRPFPAVKIDESIGDIFAFRREHFLLEDYVAGEAMIIPTPV